MCGLVDVYPNKREAMARAKKHAMECDSVTVYDLMAKRGAAQQLERTRRNDWFQAVGDQPVKARFGALELRCPPPKSQRAGRRLELASSAAAKSSEMA